MTRAEAESLLHRMTTAFDRDVSTGRRALYCDRLEAWTYDVGCRAVNHLIDSEDRFPSLSKLLERCQFFGGHVKRPHDAAAARVLMPTECERRRQRCIEKVQRTVPREIMDEVCAFSRYNQQAIARCEDELDWMASVGYLPTVVEFDAALRNYHTVLTKLCAWYADQTRKRTAPPVPKGLLAGLVQKLALPFTSDANEDA